MARIATPPLFKDDGNEEEQEESTVDGGEDNEHASMADGGEDDEHACRDGENSKVNTRTPMRVHHVETTSTNRVDLKDAYTFDPIPCEVDESLLSSLQTNRLLNSIRDAGDDYHMVGNHSSIEVRILAMGESIFH